MSYATYTVPGLEKAQSGPVVETLSGRLASLIDLSLTLKHIHWNVVGDGFIGAHEMLDQHADAVRPMVDAVAERIATMGGTPRGTPGAVIDQRSWDDYGLDKATVRDHLSQLDSVYTGVIEDHRKARHAVAELDPVTEDLLLGQLGELEFLQWLTRAHLETGRGNPEKAKSRPSGHN